MVAGFDDADFARLMDPPLTTIRQPIRQMAETAFESLLRRIRTPALAPRQILLDASLVVRDSTRRGGTGGQVRRHCMVGRVAPNAPPGG